MTRRRRTAGGIDMRRPGPRLTLAGLTLVEMLVAVAIAGILLAVATPSLTNMMERRRVVAVAGEVASLFSQARSESALQTNPIRLHMQPVPERVGAFSCLRMSTAEVGDTCRCDRAISKVCSIGSSALVREYLLPHSSSVRFSVDESVAQWGWVNYIVTIERGVYKTDVSNLRIVVKGVKSNAVLHVEYNHAGRVRTCSPDGSIGGFPACN